MNTSRRNWLMVCGAAGLAAVTRARGDDSLGPKLARIMDAPILRTELFRDPVKIDSVELLAAGKNYIVRIRGAGGLTGYSDAHDSVMSAAYPILVKKVAPHFAGQDARQLDRKSTRLNSSHIQKSRMPSSA